MIRKLINIFIVAVIILAVWKVSDGNLGSFAINLWHNGIYPIIDAASDWLLTIWHSIFG